MTFAEPKLPVTRPRCRGPQFSDAARGRGAAQALYGTADGLPARPLHRNACGGRPASRFRAFYPEIRITTTSFAKVDSRLSFGHVASPAPIRPRSPGPTCSPTT
jgi:AMP nucleosidase